MMHGHQFYIGKNVHTATKMGFQWLVKTSENSLDTLYCEKDYWNLERFKKPAVEHARNYKDTLIIIIQVSTFLYGR